MIKPVTLAVFVCLAAVAGSLAGCRQKATPEPPLATPSLAVNHRRVPLGSPLELTYRFVVAPDAHFDRDYRVMVHVVDTDEELMWTDDHLPPVPTSQWKPGQTIEYARTVWVPVYPYIGEATVQVGLYTTLNQKRAPLAGEDAGQRAYRVAKLQLVPQTENVFTVFKDGWHQAEVADHNASIEWQWTKKQATFAFRNPKKDSVFYFDVDNPGTVFQEPQQVKVSLGGQLLETFTLAPKQQVLEKIPLPAAALGAADMAELQIDVDKTFVPAAIPAANSRDPRELGVRVFHAFVDVK